VKHRSGIANLTYKDALKRLADKARVELTRLGMNVEGRSDADLVQSLGRERHRAKVSLIKNEDAE
jgi:hypothetical protein